MPYSASRPATGVLPSRASINRLGLAVAALVAIGCREDMESPAAPEAASAFSGASGGVLSFRQIDTGIGHSCGVASNYLGYCWGSNDQGQLGNGTTTFRPAPTPVSRSLRFRQLSVGRDHTCGTTTGDLVYCWGANFEGQLGDGTSFPTRKQLTPLLIAGGRHFREVQAGDRYNCAVNRSDVAFCWGSNGFGQLGDGTQGSRSTATRVKSGVKFAQVAVGGSHTCGVGTDSRIYCWGMNFWGQLGDGTQAVHTKPTSIASSLTFRQVTAGDAHSCGVTTDNRAYCWGSTNDGQLGDGTQFPPTLRIPTPVAVKGGLRFNSVSAGVWHTCAVTTQKLAYCWGDNALHQLGDGTTEDRSTPVAVTGGISFRQVSAGGFRNCGLDLEAKAYCWGASPLPVGAPTP